MCSGLFKLPPVASAQASEARDNLLGQLFGCAALVRAGQVQDPATVGRVVTMVLAAAAKKVFLREVAAEVILDMAGDPLP